MVVVVVVVVYVDVANKLADLRAENMKLSKMKYEYKQQLSLWYAIYK